MACKKSNKNNIFGFRFTSSVEVRSDNNETFAYFMHDTKQHSVSLYNIRHFVRVVSANDEVTIFLLLLLVDSFQISILSDYFL